MKIFQTKILKKILFVTKIIKIILENIHRLIIIVFAFN